MQIQEQALMCLFMRSLIKRVPMVQPFAFEKFSENIASADKPTAAFTALHERWTKVDAQEKIQTRVLFLDEKQSAFGQTIINTKKLGKAHLREVFRIFKDQNAASIVLGKNKESAYLAPNEEEKNHVRRINEMAQAMNMPVADYLHLSRNDFISFAHNRLF